VKAQPDPQSVKSTRKARTRGGKTKSVPVRGRGRGRGGLSGQGRGKRRKDEKEQADNSGTDEVDSDEEDGDFVEWNDKARDYREFPFCGQSGVDETPDDVTCPLEVLKLFLTDELIHNIVTHTNKYAQIMKETPEIIEHLNKTKRSVFKLWTPVTFDEMWVFIAILDIMGIVQKPNIAMYWTKDNFFSTPIFTRLMRRDRFE